MTKTTKISQKTKIPVWATKIKPQKNKTIQNHTQHKEMYWVGPYGHTLITSLKCDSRGRISVMLAGTGMWTMAGSKDTFYFE